MSLLGARLYDPAAAVTRATTAALAMTALDTTNLRITFTVPQSGAVLVSMDTVVHGAVTYPQVLLGVLEGAVVRARISPAQVLGGTALATTFLDLSTSFIVPGLTPGASLTWDAAYAVETGVAATGIKYGGPNDATANNAFGAFAYSIVAV